MVHSEVVDCLTDAPVGHFLCLFKWKLIGKILKSKPWVRKDLKNGYMLLLKKGFVLMNERICIVKIVFLTCLYACMFVVNMNNTSFLLVLDGCKIVSIPFACLPWTNFLTFSFFLHCWIILLSWTGNHVELLLWACYTTGCVPLYKLLWLNNGCIYLDERTCFAQVILL